LLASSQGFFLARRKSLYGQVWLWLGVVGLGRVVGIALLECEHHSALRRACAPHALRMRRA